MKHSRKAGQLFKEIEAGGFAEKDVVTVDCLQVQNGPGFTTRRSSASCCGSS